jgi:hypothetical protein
MTFPLSFAKWVVKNFYKGIYNLQEHLQRAFTKIRLECKLKCKWIQGKNKPTTKKWKKSKSKVGKKTKLNNTKNINKIQIQKK